MKRTSSHIFLFAKYFTNDDVGVAKATPYLFQEIRPAAGFKTGDFGEESWGGLP